MYILGNRIIYATHQVICEAQFANGEYMEMVADNLTCEGNAVNHHYELQHMNNDGTWSVRELPAKFKPTLSVTDCNNACYP